LVPGFCWQCRVIKGHDLQACDFIRKVFSPKAFGKSVNLDESGNIKAMSTNVAHYLFVQTFKKVLLNADIAEQEPQLLEPERQLSSAQPFPSSRPVYKARKCVFNLAPCENEFEKTFAKFIDGAVDVKAFAKLPRFSGLR
jgi:type III restriction enzyme